MKNLSKEDVNNFALQKNIHLSNEELEFVYVFVKKNWQQVVKNPKLLNLEHYKNHFSKENYPKIVRLFNEYSAKYQAFL